MAVPNVQDAPVTRMEIADAVGQGFSTRDVDRDHLLALARSGQTRTEVVRLLERLPDRRYNDLRQLWADLPDMPVR